MGRIKDTVKYIIKTLPVLDDIVIGSDSEDNGKTKNFSLRSIVNLFNSNLQAEYMTPRLKLYTSKYGGVNPDEVESDLYKDVVVYDSAASATIRVCKLIVTLEDLDRYQNPVLLIDRYTGRKSKGIGKLSLQNEFRKAGYKHQPTSIGRPTEIPLTSAKQSIDLKTESYFRFTIDGFGGVMYIEPKGRRNYNNAFRDSGTTGYFRESKVRLALRLRYEKNNQVIETDILHKVTIIARKSETVSTVFYDLI